ncbi:MAG TPA: FadR/GntR family transcriptional regulator [Solirubrobacterales bacterium]|nr:FadR/GntR family transcriptional regulator [Solirubrobacterales bacterium]
MARLHRDAMRVLIGEIVTGRLEPGDQLMREVDLAERFGVSRGVARETIRALEERGLITVRHGRGATVNEAESWNVFDPDVLGVLLETERKTEVLSEYLECRRILEVEAAGLAAARASAEDVERAAEALSRMEESAKRVPSDAAEALFHHADIDFHQALIAGTGNRALGGLVERIHSALLLARYPLARPEYRLERALPEHRRILEAVAAGDVEEARAAMRDHLDTVLSYLNEPAPSESVA